MNLADRQKCPEVLKKKMITKVNSADSFDATGLSLKIMDLLEFWVGTETLSTSHTQWSTLGTTTETSCNLMLDQIFSKSESGKPLSAPQVATLSKRLALFANIKMLVYPRLAVSQKVCEMMSERVLKGTYDEDLSAIQGDLDDDIDEDNPKSLDQHLLANYGIVADAIAFESEKGTLEKKDSEEKGSGSTSAMSDAAWFMAEMRHDISKFKKLKAEAEVAAGQLEGLEREHRGKVNSNVEQATKAFTSRCLELLPHKTDDSAIVSLLTSCIETKCQEIATHYGISSDQVLRVGFYDLGSCGAVSAPILSFVELTMPIITGNRGLGLVLASDTPSGKGRTQVKPAKAKAKSEAGSADGSGATSLPAAPSEYHVYADRGATRAMLVKDFKQVMQLFNDQSERYNEPVIFKQLGKPGARAVAVQPAANSTWQHMDLMSELQLTNMPAAEKVVDHASGAAAKARKEGRVELKSPGSAVHHQSRSQRGTGFFKHVYNDLQKAADCLTREDGKKHPILFVDMTVWGGDSVHELSP